MCLPPEQKWKEKNQRAEKRWGGGGGTTLASPPLQRGTGARTPHPITHRQKAVKSQIRISKKARASGYELQLWTSTTCDWRIKSNSAEKDIGGGGGVGHPQYSEVITGSTMQKTRGRPWVLTAGGKTITTRTERPGGQVAKDHT